MDSTAAPSWTRPDDLRPRGRRLMPIAIGAIAIGLSLTTGMLLAGEGATATTIVPVPVVSPVQVTTPAAPPAPIHVSVTAPAPVAPEPPPAPAISYRPASPKLAPACIGITADAPDPVCTWDAGFPAISADGTQIVEQVIPDDGGRGNPGLLIIFTSVATSKVVRTVTVLSPDEVVPGEPIGDKLRAKIERRAAAAQQLIDAKQFRPLVWLGTSSGISDVVDLPAERSGVHAEFVGSTMRLLDPATRTELWRRTFSAPSPFGEPDPAQDCNHWSFAELQAWWEPSTRIVLGRMIYHHGGCMCDSSSVSQVFRF